MKIWSEKIGGKKWWFADFTQKERGHPKGKRYRPRAESRAELDEIIDTARRRVRQEKYGLTVERARITLEELTEERVADYDRAIKNHRRAIAVIEDFTARFPAGYAVTELSTVDLRDFVKQRQREFQVKEKEKAAKRAEEARAAGREVPATPIASISPETINKELGYISAMLNAAPDMFKALQEYRPPKMPWARTPRRRRKRPISTDEDEKLLTALRAPQQKAEQPRTAETRHEIADLFELNLNTGMRGGESVRLTWPQIDFQSEEIYLGKTKNGEDRFVPMNSRVREILRRRFESRNGSPYVFPNPSGESFRYDYLRTFKRVAEALGLPYGQRRENGFTMHSTRHTATTRLLRAGHDVATVQEIVGHSDRTMTLFYSHASAKSRKRAVESLTRASLDKKSAMKKR